jgi:hypothetical protein
MVSSRSSEIAPTKFRQRAEQEEIPVGQDGHCGGDPSGPQFGRSSGDKEVLQLFEHSVLRKKKLSVPQNKV